MITHPQIAIVTGAAKRIGRAIALDLAAHGWRLAIHHNSSAAQAHEVVVAIQAMGGQAVAFAANLEDASAVAGLVPACLGALGAPTLLVNNASLFLPDAVGSLSLELWERHQAVNLRAPVMLAQAMAKHLPEGAEGNVINIIDQRVLRPVPTFFSYGISKDGLFAATTMLAQALAPRIRVNAIGPGPVLQSIHQTAAEFDAQNKALPLGRGTDPAEMAAAVQFLISARAMTGQILALDGGQHLDWRMERASGNRPKPGTAAVAASPAPAAISVPQSAHGLRHVLIRQLEIKTIIGAHDEEKRAPQRVWVNLDLSVREDGPSISDKLADVLDYGVMVQHVTKIVQAGDVNLVETLAERVAAACLTDRRVVSVRVRIEKPDVIANVKSVGVEIERRRS